MSSSPRLRSSALILFGLFILTEFKESRSSFSTTSTTTSPVNLLPYFDFDVPRNLTVTVGQTGFLHCRVERLGDKDVSWIRKRDLHILTAGSTTYTSDQRFQVLRPENSGNWTLQIKYPQPRDSGIYECQINTEPKMSLSYTFNVIEMKANIVGPSDLYVKSGSDINLTCKILQGPHELGNIFWYKGSDIIDATTNQNEIDGAMRISVENDWHDGLTSRLKIRRAMPSDTGNYTCFPTIAKTSSVYVHVIIGEHPAAMQHNSSSMNSQNFYSRICCMLFTLFTCCLQHLLATTTMALSAAAATSGSTTMLGARGMAAPPPPPPLKGVEGGSLAAVASIAAASAAILSVALNNGRGGGGGGGGRADAADATADVQPRKCSTAAETSTVRVAATAATESLCRTNNNSSSTSDNVAAIITTTSGSS